MSQKNGQLAIVSVVELVFDVSKLCEILKVPDERIKDYIQKANEGRLWTMEFAEGRVNKIPRKVLKEESAPIHKLLFFIMNKVLLYKWKISYGLLQRYRDHKCPGVE